MGCDIHSFAERRDASGAWRLIEGCIPFEDRSYALFGWLAGVRNYSDLPVLAEARGIPADASAEVVESHGNWGCDAHSASWLAVNELLDFDYDQPVENLRVTRRTARGYDGGCTALPGEGELTTFRNLFGPSYFDRLDQLRASGAERVVFWFDN